MSLKQKNKIKGILMMIGAVIAFSIMGGLVRSKPDISAYASSFYRFGVGIAILGLLAITNVITLKFTNKKLLIIRGLLGGANVYIYYLVIQKLGVGIGTVLAYSYPIFASIFSALFLKDRITLWQWGYIFVAISGLLLLASAKSGMLSIGLYEIIAIASAITSGAIIVMVKKLHETDDSYAIFFSQSLFGFIILFLPSKMVDVDFGLSVGLLFLFIGLTAAAGQLLMTESYFHIDVTTGSILILLVPVLNMIVGNMLFAEVYETTDIIGAIMIILSCGLIIYSRNKKIAPPAT